MNCPECNHEIERHGENGCFFTIIPPPYSFRNPHKCDCQLSAVDALKAAQRARAFDYIRLLRSEASEELEHCGQDSESYRWRVGRVRDAIMAYRSIHLFEERKP